jgi:hypothetical protein
MVPAAGAKVTTIGQLVPGWRVPAHPDASTTKFVPLRETDMPVIGKLPVFAYVKVSVEFVPLGILGKANTNGASEAARKATVPVRETVLVPILRVATTADL